jgi:hypothetical protein
MTEYDAGDMRKIAYNCAQLSLTLHAISFFFLQILRQRVDISENIKSFLILNFIFNLILFLLL